MMDTSALKYAEKVFLVLKRQKTTLFFVASEIDNVIKLKRFLSKMLQMDIENVRLTYQDRELYNSVRLFEYGISPKVALPHSPAMIGVQLRKCEKDKFERLEIVDNTTTPTPEQLLPMQETDSESTSIRSQTSILSLKPLELSDIITETVSTINNEESKTVEHSEIVEDKEEAKVDETTNEDTKL